VLSTRIPPAVVTSHRLFNPTSSEAALAPGYSLFAPSGLGRCRVSPPQVPQGRLNNSQTYLSSYWIRSLPSVISPSIVPMGLVLMPMHNPGTEVPGYFLLVPTGRKMAKLQRTLQGPSTNCHS
jgi:hypothetical protein